jgi:hypothetical protein
MLYRRSEYDKMKLAFQEAILKNAYWKAVDNEKCENVNGAFMENSKNCDNCFFSLELEDCSNVVRGFKLKDALDSVCAYGSELVYLCAMVQEGCYDVSYCHNIIRSKFLRYSMNCWDCENCFACCGLVRKRYCILNKQYTENDYHQLKAKIEKHIENEGIVGQFFPYYFAPNNYEESLASFYYPLTKDEQKKLGYRLSEVVINREPSAYTLSDIPDNALEVSKDISTKIFWDEEYLKPFRITDFDVQFSKSHYVPLPNGYYIKRIKDLFQWMHFNGSLREAKCTITGERVMTNLPENFTGRIVCEDAYRNLF